MQIVTYPEWSSAEKIKKSMNVGLYPFSLLTSLMNVLPRLEWNNENWSNSFVDVSYTSYSIWDMLEVD